MQVHLITNTLQQHNFGKKMISNINKTKSKKPKGGIQIGNIANTKYYKMPDGSVIDDQGKPAPAAIVAALQPVMQKESVLVSKSKKISSIERKDKSKEKNYFAIDKNIITSLLKSLNSLTTKMNKVLDESKKITLRYNVLNKNIQTSDLIMTNRARSFVEEINKLKDDVSQIFKSAPKFSQTGAIASAITPTSDMSKDIKGTPEKDNQGNSGTEGLLAGIFGGAVAGSLMKSILRTVVKTVLSRPFMIAAGITTFMYQYQKEQVRRQKEMGFADNFDPWTGKVHDKDGKEISQEEIEKRSRELRQKERDTGRVDQGIKFKGRKEQVGERQLIQEIMEGKRDLEIGILPNQSENEKNKIREQEAQKVNNGTTKLKVIPVERTGGLTGKTNTNEKSDTEKKNIEKVQNQNAVIEQRTVLIDQVKQGKKDAELYIDDKLPEREKNLTRENAALRVAQGISWEEITRGRREYDTQKKIIDQQKNASANNTSSDTSKDFNQFKPTETNFGAFGESPVSSPQSVSTAPVAPPAATPTAPVAPAPAPGPRVPHQGGLRGAQRNLHWRHLGHRRRAPRAAGADALRLVPREAVGGLDLLHDLLVVLLVAERRHDGEQDGEDGDGEADLALLAVLGVLGDFDFRHGKGRVSTRRGATDTSGEIAGASARQPFGRSGLVARDPRAVPGAEVTGLKVRAGLRHQVEVEVEVVESEERAAEDLAGHREVAQVGTGKTRGVVRQPLHDGTRISAMTLVAQVKGAVRREDEAVAGHAGRQHAIEHIHSERHHAQQLRRGTESHGVARLPRGKERSRRPDLLQHFRLGLPDAHPADGIAWKIQRRQRLRGLPPQVVEGRSLHDREDVVTLGQKPAVGRDPPALRRPTQAARDRPRAWSITCANASRRAAWRSTFPSWPQAAM